MNKCIEIGTLCHDIEGKTSQGGTSMASFRIAVRRNFKNAEGKYESDFINCKAFGKTAEIVRLYTQKGKQVAITGEIQTGSYTNKEGRKVYTTDIICSQVQLLGSADQTARTTQNAQAPAPAPQPDPDSAWEQVDDIGDDLPF